MTGIDATIVIGEAEQTWRFHDTSLLQALLIERSVVTGSLHEPSLLVVQGRLLYPCRDPDHWRPCALADLIGGTDRTSP